MSESGEGSTPAKKQRLSTSVTELSSEADASIVDMETQKALEDIDMCQNEIDSLNEKASEEILMIEQKYNKLRKPHFEKRSDLIKQIPNFWVTTFINHPQISHLISEAEEKCLRYLTSMDVCEFEDIKSGYSLTFHFSANPYFSNQIISKSYFLAIKDSHPYSKSSVIQWKNGKDLSKALQSKKVQRHIPGAGPKVGSFFSWFKEESGNPLSDKIADSEKEQEHILGAGPRVGSFFSWFKGESGNPLSDKIADILKDDIWPNPVQYYLAPAIEVEENGRTDDDSDDDDSVVIVGDDSEDSEDEDDLESVDELDESGGLGDDSVEYLEIDDDDDDDDDEVEVIESDTELETTGGAENSMVLDSSAVAEKSMEESANNTVDESKTSKDLTQDSTVSTETSKSGVDSNKDVSSTSKDNGDKNYKSDKETGENEEVNETESVKKNALDKDNETDNAAVETQETVDDGGTNPDKEVVKDGGDTGGKTDSTNVSNVENGGGEG